MADAPFDIVVERVGEAWHERLSRWILAGLGEATAMVLGLALVVIGAVAISVERGEADLAAAVPNVEAAFADAFAGREADIGELRVRALPGQGRIRLIGRDIAVEGRDGQLAGLRALNADFDWDAAIQRRPELLSLDVDGGIATLVRENGKWKAGLGRPETLGQLGPVIPVGAGGNRGLTPSIAIQGATLYVVDRDRGVSLRLDDVTVRADQGAVEAAGRLAEVHGGGTIRLRRARNGHTDVAFSGVRPATIAKDNDALGALAGIDLALDGEVSVKGDAPIAFDVASVGEGALALGETPLSVESLSAKGTLDLASRELAGDVEIVSDRIRTAGFLSGRVEGGKVYGRARMGQSRLRVEALPRPELDLDGMSSTYSYDVPSRDLDLRGLDVGLAGVRLRGYLGLAFGDGGVQSATARLEMDGDLEPADLLSLWPEGFVGGARRWIERAVLDGRISDLVVVADLPREAFQGGEVMIDGELNRRPLPDDALLLTFAAEDARVRYISTMTPLEGARGRGELRGNSFTFDLDAGRVGTLGVRSARVEMPRLVPKGGPMTIRVDGEGGAETMLRLIDEEPFGFARLYGIDPAQFGGRGEVDITITRPIREFITPDQVSYSVRGAFTDASVPFTLFGQPLTDGRIALEADATQLRLAGPVRFGPWEADLTYIDVLGDGGDMPTQATLTGDVSRDALDAFGIGLRRFFDGDVPVRVSALTNGLQLLSADVRADLTEANLTFDPYWAKPKGVAADLTLKAVREGEITTANDIVLRAPGVELQADLALRLDGALERLDVERLVIRDVMDLRASVVPNADRSRLSIEASGPFIDVSPAVEERLRDPAAANGLPIELQGTFDTLVLAQDYELESAEVLFEGDAAGVERARLAGSVGGQPATAALVPRETGRELTVRLPDASGAATALFGWSGIRGGVLRLDAGLPPVGEPGAMLGEVAIDDIALERAPILAQLLSLASLTGLGDTLSGQGLNFRKVRGEFGFRDGVLSLRDTRASGPALGITVEGEVGLGSRKLDLNGVLVPAYTANSLLGDIPLIGDLLVGDKGEGIVSLGYTVQGPYSAAQIAVNPLSALTPGVLREMFEPQRDGLEEMMEEGAP